MKAATNRDLAGAGAVCQSGTAAVVRLASADGPVVQQHPPRGRRPKNVLSLWRARLDHTQAVKVLALQAQFELVQNAKDECLQRAKAAWANLKEAERLDKLIDTEYSVLKQQLEAIKAQLAQAAERGPA